MSFKILFTRILYFAFRILFIFNGFYVKVVTTQSQNTTTFPDSDFALDMSGKVINNNVSQMVDQMMAEVYKAFK